MLSVRKVQRNPQVLSTNRHIMQGQRELSDVKWDNKTLSGKANFVAGEPMKIVIALNGWKPVDNSGLTVSTDGQTAALMLDSPKNGAIDWRVKFE
jgi:hypothetical protein